MIALSVALVAIGIGLLLAAVAMLAGPWWAVGALGALATYAGYVVSTHTRRGGADELAAPQANR